MICPISMAGGYGPQECREEQCMWYGKCQTFQQNIIYVNLDNTKIREQAYGEWQKGEQEHEKDPD